MAGGGNAGKPVGQGHAFLLRKQLRGIEVCKSLDLPPPHFIPTALPERVAVGTAQAVDFNFRFVLANGDD